MWGWGDGLGGECWSYKYEDMGLDFVLQVNVGSSGIVMSF